MILLTILIYEGLPPGPIYIPEPSVIDAVLNHENITTFTCVQGPFLKQTRVNNYKEHLKNYNK